MAWSIVQQNEAAENVGAATVAATLTSPATAGNLILVVVGADAYASTPPTGFTESTGCKLQTNLGHYVWWKVAVGGETSVSYTIGSVATSVWEIFEISGLTASPYDISNGTFLASGASTFTTPSITPTAGERLIVASMGGSTSAANFTGLSAWLNSFTEQNDTMNTKASGTRDIIGMATLSATADGLTGYSSGATYSPNATARTGIIIAFKVLAAGPSIAPTGVSVPIALGSPTADWSTTAGPDGLSLPVTLGAPIVGAASVDPGGITVPVGVGDPTLTWSATVAPDGISAPVALGSPIIGAAPVAPDGLSVPVTLGSPSLAWSGAVSPDGIGVPVVIGAPSLNIPGAFVTRPNTGGVVRPGTGTVARPSTGSVTRPASGTVTRPDTGVVSRP